MNKKLLLVAAATMMLVACKNGQNEPEQQEPVTKQQAMKTYFAAPVAFNGTFVETSNALLYATKSQSSPAPARILGAETYPVITWTPQDGTWPIDLTVEYGTEGVIASDGLLHSGKMAIHATGRFEQEGSEITPSFTDFYVYGNILTAKQVIKNEGKNDNENLVFDVKVDDGFLGEQKQLIYSEHTSRELINGLQENGFMDPVVTTHTYSITGWMKTESKIDSIPGCSVTISEDEPMVIAVGDLYPTQGKLNIEFDKELSYTFQGIEVKYKSVDLVFTGKQNGKYGAEVEIDYMVGSIEQTLQLSFLLDENGIIPESITPIVE